MGKPPNKLKYIVEKGGIKLKLLLPSILVILILVTTAPAAAIVQPPGQPGFASNNIIKINNLQTIPDSLQVLHSFAGPDGSSPNSLLQSTSGLLYGTTASGGDTSACPSDGCGIIYTLDAGGNFTQLHTFHATDGYLPTGLLQAGDNDFYGTTLAGGQPSGGGAGTLFHLDATGSLTTLYAFTGGFSCCDGASPVGHPILASDGNLYGLTGAGGDFRDVDHPGGFGTFYQYNPISDTLTILHSFNISDGNGIFPSGSLVQGNDGYFYGVTREAGLGGGTIFRLDSSGNITLLHAFTDSAEPLDGLIQAADGFFYGTTDGGATAGTIFRIDSTGDYSVLNRFDGADGYKPHFGLMQASDGFLYGTTPKGGLLDFQAGALFRMSNTGALSVLHSFTQSDPVTGIIPNSVLVQATGGIIYGTAGLGGANMHGTVYRFDPTTPTPVASIVVTPPDIITPGNAIGTVTLSSPAQVGGIVVNLHVTSFNVIIPLSVTVPEGMMSADFDIQALQVNQVEDVRLYASVQGEGIRTNFSLLPPGPTPTPTSTPVPPTSTPSPTPTEPSPTPTATSTPPPKILFSIFLPLSHK